MESQMVLYSVLLIFICWGQTTNGQVPVIPLNVYHRMANVTSVSAFIDNMVRPNNYTTSNAISNLLFDIVTGSINPIGKNIIIAQIAEEDGCSPRLRSVTLPTDPLQPNLLFYPSCVKLMRCGGCCSHDLYECSPTSVSMTSVSVLKAIYPYQGAEYFEIIGIQNVEMEHHESCECRCRVQPHNCHPTKQEYVASECKCQCLNREMASRCGPVKKWDDAQCECVCPHEYYCLGDEEFSQSTCRCEVKTFDLPPAETSTSSTVDDVVEDECTMMRCLAGYVASLVNGVCDCVVEEIHDLAGTNPLANYGSNTNQRPGSSSSRPGSSSSRPGSTSSQTSSTSSRTRTRASSTSTSTAHQASNTRGTGTETSKQTSNTGNQQPQRNSKTLASPPSGDGIHRRQPMVQGRQGHLWRLSCSRAPTDTPPSGCTSEDVNKPAKKLSR